jgi:hypothetical protein
MKPIKYLLIKGMSFLQISKIIFFFLILVLLINTKLSNAQDKGVNTFIVYEAWGLPSDYKESLSGYSILVDSRINMLDKYIAMIKESFSKLKIFHYMNMLYIETDSVRHCDAWAPDIMSNHQDFLLLNNQGRKDSSLPARKKYAWGYSRPYDSTSTLKGRFFLNPASLGWTKYYANLARSILTKNYLQNKEGIFVDNVWSEISAFFQRKTTNLQIDFNGDGIVNSFDASAWEDAIVKFSKIVKSELGPNIPLIANSDYLHFGTHGLHIIKDAAFDGIFNEGFLFAYTENDSSIYPNLPRWIENENYIFLINRLNKMVLLEAKGKKQDHQARLFSLGSFLLAESDNSYFNYRFSVVYDFLYRFPEFNIVTGKPLESFKNIEDAFDKINGLYKRSFDSVDVYVNPFNYSLQLNEPSYRRQLVLNGGLVGDGGYYRWEKGRNFTVAPHSALILSKN